MRRVSEIVAVLGRDAIVRAASIESTKKAARELARDVKPSGVTLGTAADLIREAADLMRRRQAVPGWQRRRGWSRMSEAGRRSGRVGCPVLLPSGSLWSRLVSRYRADAVGLIRSVFRGYAREESPVVAVVDTFAEADASLCREEGWIDYKDRNRYGVVSAQYTVCLMRGWWKLPNWLKDCDGLLTLAAVRLPDDEGEGEEVYRARWAGQGRSGPSVCDGFIVRRVVDGRAYTAHGKSLGAARSVVTRQLPEYLAAASERERKRAERIERVKSRVRKSLEAGCLNGYEVEVTLSDSSRAGNCNEGTAAWVNRHFPGRRSAMVSEVLSVDDQRERVLLACVAAVRRQRPEVFAAE